MKRFVTIVLVLAVVGLLSCNKKVVIPDNTLADIFHDAFLTNAYIENESINLDSLHIYESIFNRYGYTSEDVIYTIGNFSRRKSARLGTVVEQAISRLETESNEFAQQVVILDTIRDVAVRTYTRTLYQDTLIKARRRADSTRLSIVIEPVTVGNYIISCSVECEDDLEKYGREASFYFEDENGMKKSTTHTTLRKTSRINRTLVSHNENNRRLVIELGNYKEKRRPRKQHLDIRNLKVVYKPTDMVAIDSLYEHYLPIKIFADGFLIKKDSVALSADSTRVSTPTTPLN